MTLEKLRKEIDNIDSQIFNLLTERLKYVKQVGSIKKTEDRCGSIIRPAREANMLRNIYKKAKSEGYSKQIAKGFAVLWRQIISVSVNHEENTNISYIENDNISDAKEYFGSFSKWQKCSDYKKIFENIKSGKSNIAILPLSENEKIKPWWLEMAEKYGDFSIFAGFPFFDKGMINSIAISNIKPEASGNDVFAYVLSGKINNDIKNNFKIISAYKDNYLIFSDEYQEKYKAKFNLKYIGCFAKF